MNATGTETASHVDEELLAAVPWTVVILNDPVNLLDYVTWALGKVFGYPKERALRLTMEAHQTGRSIVWAGERERAEFFAQQLQGLQLSAIIEKAA